MLGPPWIRINDDYMHNIMNLNEDSDIEVDNLMIDMGL